MRKMKTIFNVVIVNIVILFLSMNLSAGKTDTLQAQQKKEDIPRWKYNVDVSVSRIDVIVTDKKGNRITGLKPENFKIFEDNVPQRTSHFFEVKGMEVYTSVSDKKSGELTATPRRLGHESSSQERNKIVIYFDNWHLSAMNRNWGIKKLKLFIQNNFPLNTRNQGMIVCLDQKLEIVQKFTTNRMMLMGAIDKVKKIASQSLLRKKTKDDLKNELKRIVSNTNRSNRYEQYEMALGIAKSYIDSEKNDLLYSLKSLNAFINHLAGIPGRKILIYVSDGIPINPGEDVFHFLEQFYPRGKTRSEAMNYDATRTLKELTAKCNSREITLYPINARGLEGMTFSADTQKSWNFNSRGSGMGHLGLRKNEALKMMAGDTGGVAVLNTNDIKTGLKKIENDLQYYYTLGYESLHSGDNNYHSLKVKLVGVDKKYKVRVRQGYKGISRNEQIEENVISRLFLGNQYNPSQIRIQIVSMEKIPLMNKVRLTLKLLIPLKNLGLYPRAEDYYGQLKIYFALKDSDGQISPCNELSETIAIPIKDYDIALGKYYPYLVEMKIHPGSYKFSLGIMDVQKSSINYIQFNKSISMSQLK